MNILGKLFTQNIIILRRKHNNNNYKSKMTLENILCYQIIICVHLNNNKKEERSNNINNINNKKKRTYSPTIRNYVKLLCTYEVENGFYVWCLFLWGVSIWNMFSANILCLCNSMFRMIILRTSCFCFNYS